jgi:hypothetical protein
MATRVILYMDLQRVQWRNSQDTHVMPVQTLYKSPGCACAVACLLLTSTCLKRVVLDKVMNHSKTQNPLSSVWCMALTLV